MGINHFTLKILRGHPSNQYWEEFTLERIAFLNVISALMLIQKRPFNAKGEKVEPVVWESGCLEEVCGSCSMLINGRPRQACTALIDRLIDEAKTNTITLAPLSKFPLVRDLMCDRTQMFENLKKAHAWIDTEDVSNLGPGPRISPEKQEMMYSLATCMTCGCCVEACPQSNEKTAFLGPQIFSQMRFFNDHPTGHLKQEIRLTAAMEKGGISACGNAQNCVKVCPKGIPLTDSIATIGRETSLQAFRNLYPL